MRYWRSCVRIVLAVESLLGRSLSAVQPIADLGYRLQVDAEQRLKALDE
jgi:hypothetical protein